MRRPGALNQDNPDVMSYLRAYKDKAVLVALNMSATPHKVSFNLAEKGFPSAHLRDLVATPHTSVEGTTVSLEPFGILISEVTK